MKVHWLCKINFHLYVTSARTSSLLLYAYRKGFGSTIVNLSDVKIDSPTRLHFPTPPWWKPCSSPRTVFHAAAKCNSSRLHHHIILSPTQVWQTALWLKISKRRGPLAAAPPECSLCLRLRATCFLHRGEGPQVLGSGFCLLTNWLQNVSTSQHLGCHLPESDTSQITQSQCRSTACTQTDL